jgi:hypothetical protein
MRERVLGVQAGLTSVTNEVVILVMVGGAGSTSARGLRRLARHHGRGRRRRIHVNHLYVGREDVRPHASNRVLVTVVTQGAVRLKKSRAVVGRERRRRVGRVAATVGRMHVLWICLVRSQIWTARVTVFNETTGVPLIAMCNSRNFMGIIVNIGGKFWASHTRFACWRWRVGQCHGRWWLVNPHSLCWELCPARGRAVVILLFWLLTLSRGPTTILFRMKRASLKY